MVFFFVALFFLPTYVPTYLHHPLQLSRAQQIRSPCTGASSLLLSQVFSCTSLSPAAAAAAAYFLHSSSSSSGSLLTCLLAFPLSSLFFSCLCLFFFCSTSFSTFCCLFSLTASLSLWKTFLSLCVCLYPSLFLKVDRLTQSQEFAGIP